MTESITAKFTAAKMPKKKKRLQLLRGRRGFVAKTYQIAAQRIPLTDLMTQKLGMCAWVKTRSTMQRKKTPNTVLYTSTLKWLHSTPCPSVRHRTSNRSECCQHRVDPLGSGSEHTCALNIFRHRIAEYSHPAAVSNSTGQMKIR